MSRLKTSKTVKHCENQRLLQIDGGQVWMQRAPGKGTNTIKYVPSSLETGMGDSIGNRQSQTIIDNRFKTRFDPQFCKEWTALKNNEQQWTTLKSYFWNRLAWRQSEVGCICSGQAELLDGLDDNHCICQFKPNNLTLHMSWCYMCVDYIMIDILWYIILCCTSSIYLLHYSWSVDWLI